MFTHLPLEQEEVIEKLKEENKRHNLRYYKFVQACLSFAILLCVKSKVYLHERLIIQRFQSMLFPSSVLATGYPGPHIPSESQNASSTIDTIRIFLDFVSYLYSSKLGLPSP